MHNIRDLESFRLGYAVGLYEGEGTINVFRKAAKNRVYARLVVRMTDREPVEATQLALGGIVRDQPPSPHEAARGYKPKFRWSLGTVDEVIDVATFMLPHVSARRRAQLEAALAEIQPRVRQPVVAGNRRRGELPTLQPRKVGELACPAEPEPSARGYQRHLRLGISVCDVCRESFRLYYAERRKWYKDKTREINRTQYLKRKARSLAEQEGEVSEITD